METTNTLVVVCLAIVSVFSTQQGGANRLPPVCQVWNSTAVVCSGQTDPWEYPTRATLTQVPIGIPHSVTALDLSGNNITELYKDSFARLRALRFLDLSGNSITKLYDGSFHGLRNLRHLDLSETNLHTIEVGAFAGLENLERLDMCCSTLQATFSLQNGLFRDLKNLNYLAVETSTNVVHAGVFKDLIRLKYLYLGLSDMNSLPDHIFDSLSFLENLTLVEQGPLLDGLSTAVERRHSGSRFLQRHPLWSPLQQLQNLHLFVATASDLYFGSVFRNLSKLETVQVASYGPVDFNAQMFRPLLETLQRLDLRHNAHFHMQIDGLTIEPGLLESLGHLQALDIPWTSFASIADVLPELRYTQIQELSFAVGGVQTITVDTLAPIKGLNDLKTLSITLPDTESIQANSFTSFPQLQRLDMRVGFLKTVQNKAFSGLSSLTYLDLSHHFISILPQSVFHGLSSLHHLDLSYNELETSQAWLPEKLDYLDLSHNNLNSYLQFGSWSPTLSFNFTHLQCVNHLNLSYNRLGDVESGLLPGNLTVLDLQHNNIGNYVPDSVVSIAGLKYLDLSYNNIESTTLDSIDQSQYSTLETLKLDSNAISGIDGAFTKVLINLKMLTLSHNQISVIVAENFQWSVRLVQLDLSHNEINTLTPFAFRGLSRLIYLDLSYNHIQNMTEMTFEGLVSLRQLNLAANKIAVIGNAFHRLYGLKILILSNNRLSILNQTSLGSVVNRLDRLDVADNPFLCDCNLLWFVKWAQDMYDRVVSWHNPYPLPDRSYKCSRPSQLYGRRLLDGLTQEQHYNDGHDPLESTFFNKDCSHEFRPNRLLACVLASSGIFVAMMAVFLVDYNMAHVYYYLWMWAKWRRPRIGEVKIHEPQNYTHDAFIAYNSEDVMWVRREAIANLEPDYSLVIHQRDFAAGAPIVENIADAVQNSRRTVCIISRNFLRSKWCEYEFQLAQYHMFEQGGGVRLILVFLEKIPTRLLKQFRHLNAVMKRDTYLEWPGDVKYRPLFWRRLRYALGDPLPQDPQPQQQVHITEQHIPEQQAQSPKRTVSQQQAKPPVRNVAEQRAHDPESQPKASARGTLEEQAPALECEIPEQQAQALERERLIPKQGQTSEPKSTKRQDSEDEILEEGAEDDWCETRSDILLLPL